MTKKLNEYTVMIKIELDTDITIRAASLEDAIEQSKSIDLRDVVKFDGGYNDGNIEITGVFK